MSIIFKYSKIPREDGTLVDAPYIPVFARDKNGKLIRISALLDSGADTSVIPFDLAKVLGLKQDTEEFTTGGIGGKARVKESQLSIVVKGPGPREQYQLTFPVLVLQDENIDVPLILGRKSFFEKFDITFRQKSKRIVLKKV